MNELPGLYAQCEATRLDGIEIPLGWVRSVESIRPYAKNLIMMLGVSGAGRDTLLDAIREAYPDYQRIRRTTTRPYREEEEQGRILSVPPAEFRSAVKQNSIICSYLYPPNAQFYGVSLSELEKLRQGKGLLEGTSELIPLKILLPESKLFVILPESLSQLTSQLENRDGRENAETTRRLLRVKRELSVLFGRLPNILNVGLVNGVLINAPPLKTSVQRAIVQISKSL